jgi:hypothetical protein
MIVTPNQSDVFAALGAFLTAVLPSGVEIVQGQDNRVAQPLPADHVVLWVIHDGRLGTNVVTFTDSTQNNAVMESAEITIQIDVHGPNSADNAKLIVVMWRTDFAVDTFAASNPSITPLYADEARQVPFHDGEQQVETRYTIDAVLQADQTVTVPQQSSTSFDLSLGVVTGDDVVVTDPTTIPQP